MKIGFGIEFFDVLATSIKFEDFVNLYNITNQKDWVVSYTNDSVFVGRYLTEDEQTNFLVSLLVDNNFQETSEKIILSDDLQKLWGDIIMEIVEQNKTNEDVLQSTILNNLQIKYFKEG